MDDYVNNNTKNIILFIVFVYFRRQNDDNDSSQMDTTPKAKRARSGSSPYIESVSSASPVTTMSIVLNLDNKEDNLSDSNNSSPKSHSSVTLACSKR